MVHLRISIVDNTDVTRPRVIAEWSPVPITELAVSKLAFAQIATANANQVRSYEIYISEVKVA